MDWMSFRPHFGDVFLWIAWTGKRSESKRFRPLIGEVFLNYSKKTLYENFGSFPIPFWDCDGSKKLLVKCFLSRIRERFLNQSWLSFSQAIVGTNCRPRIKDVFLNSSTNQSITSSLTSFRPILGRCFLTFTTAAVCLCLKGFRPLIGEMFLNYSSRAERRFLHARVSDPLLGMCFLTITLAMLTIGGVLFPTPYWGCVS